MRYILTLTITLTLLAAFMVPVFAADAKVTYTAPTTQEISAAQQQGRYLATITMQDGAKIEIVLEGAYMPYTVANFVKLANAKFYDGLVFHRVEENFVIQGGDPQGDGTGSPGYAINLEISPYLNHNKGAISMARSAQMDSAGSQFFITLDKANFLDRSYAVFGWAKSGMDVVEKVQVGDKMKSVTVQPYKGTEPCPILDDKYKPKEAAAEEKKDK